MRGSAPGERRGGRSKGTLNRRTIAATELLQRAQERFPDYNPIEALIALAKSTGDPVLQKECHIAILPYTVPKFRQVEADPDALVELEGRLHAARLHAAAGALAEHRGLVGLAERLARADVRAAAESITLASCKARA